MGGRQVDDVGHGYAGTGSDRIYGGSLTRTPAASAHYYSARHGAAKLSSCIALPVRPRSRCCGTSADCHWAASCVSCGVDLDAGDGGRHRR